MPKRETLGNAWLRIHSLDRDTRRLNTAVEQLELRLKQLERRVDRLGEEPEEEKDSSS